MNTFTDQNDIEKSDKTNSEYLSGEFPAKPKPEKEANSAQRTVLSIIVFIAISYLIFKWNIGYILVLALVILIHEMGHYLAMRIFNYKDLSIFFIPLIGAYASGTKDRVSQKQETIILLAGPVPGVIIGSILYYFGLRDSTKFLITASNIFIIINLFNLLPIMPLDGGKMIRSIFFASNEKINYIFLLLSIILLTFLSIILKSYALLIIPVLLIMNLSRQSQMRKLKKEIKNKEINLDQSYDDLSDRDYWLIRDEIATHIKYFAKYISAGSYLISDKESTIIKQVKSILERKPIMDLGILGKILITFCWIMIFIIPLVVVAIYYIKLRMIR
jgi:stage IV sporulation protein FB